VKEASRRGISIIFEDHGDYPDEIKRHLALVKAQHYETFLAESTISPQDMINYSLIRAEQTGFHGKLQWAQAYHLRFQNAMKELENKFDAGELFKKIPDFAGRNSKYIPVARWEGHQERPEPEKEIIDAKAYHEYKSWGDVAVPQHVTREIERLDDVMGRERATRPIDIDDINQAGRGEGFLHHVMVNIRSFSPGAFR